MRKLLTLLFSFLLVLNLSVGIKADEADTILLSNNTQDYTYLSHPSYNEGTKKIVVAEGVEYIGDYTFFRMKDLEEVVLPSTVKEIGDYAFYECTNLSIINLDNVDSVGKYSFYGCESLNVDFFGNKGAHALDFEGDKQLSYNMSLGRVNAMIDYLNEVYLTSDLGFDIDYCSPLDIQMLQSLADYITEDCDTETEKADAIYEWVKTNITYGQKSGSDPSSPIDVYRYGVGICSGYSQLISTLAKLSGMPSAIVRCKKENTKGNVDYLNIYVSLDFTYNWNKYHEFSMIYADGEWKEYDALYDIKGESDLEEIATNQFILHIDGVYAYSDEGFDLVKNGRSADVYYYDGQYHVLDIKHSYKTGGSSLLVGACLVYNRWFYWGYYNNYYVYQGDTSNLIKGLAYPGGWYLSQGMGSDMYCLRYNGTAVESSIKKFNDSSYLFTRGSSVTVDDSFLDIGFINGDVSMYLGEELNFSEDDVTIINYSPIFEVNGTTIKAVSTGVGYVEFNLNRNTRNNVEIWFNVYGDVQTSNDLFKTLCAHTTTHEVYEVEYCDYCGSVIEQEEEVVEEETVEQETMEEETTEEQEVVEEESSVDEEIEQEEAVEEIEQQEEETEQEETEVVEEQEEDMSQEVAEEEQVEEVESSVPEVVDEEVVEEVETSDTDEVETPEVNEKQQEEETIELIEETQTTDEQSIQQTPITASFPEALMVEETAYEIIEMVEAPAIEHPAITYTSYEEAIELAKEVIEDTTEQTSETIEEETISVVQESLEVTSEAEPEQANNSLITVILVALADLFKALFKIFR